MENHITEKVTKLRNRAGLSMQKMAVSMGMKGASSWQYYENPVLYNKEYIPQNILGKMIKTLVGKGDPPISADEIMALGGSFGASGGQTPFLSRLPIKGKVAAGIWAEPQEPIFRDDILALPEPDLEFQFGLEVSGDSLKDLNCLDGDILHCVSTQAMYPTQDDVVIAESVRGDLYEYTAKILKHAPGKPPELHAANDKYPPIKMDEMPEDREIRVIGKVVRVFRELR